MTTEGKKVSHPEYDVRLRVLPVDHGDENGIRRLRAFLKCAIRSWRLQCVRITEATKPATEARP